MKLRCHFDGYSDLREHNSVNRLPFLPSFFTFTTHFSSLMIKMRLHFNEIRWIQTGFSLPSTLKREIVFMLLSAQCFQCFEWISKLALLEPRKILASYGVDIFDVVVLPPITKYFRLGLRSISQTPRRSIFRPFWSWFVVKLRKACSLPASPPPPLWTIIYFLHLRDVCGLVCSSTGAAPIRVDEGARIRYDLCYFHQKISDSPLTHLWVECSFPRPFDFRICYLGDPLCIFEVFYNWSNQHWQNNRKIYANFKF